MKDLGDRAAQGRACGNLGNTHYLLGNFDLAIMYHEEVSNSSPAFIDRSDFNFNTRWLTLATNAKV